MVLIHKSILCFVLLLYWFLESFQTTLGSVLDAYAVDMWKWGWYDKWYDDILNASRKSNRKRLAHQNRYLMVRKRVETVPASPSPGTKSDHSSADMLSLSEGDAQRFAHNVEPSLHVVFRLHDSRIVQTQVYDIVKQWSPVFCSDKCDIRIVAQTSRMKLSVQVNYSTTNDTYQWGLMNTKTGQILGKIKLQPGKNNTTTIHFAVRRMVESKRYRFRLMQRMEAKGYAYLHLNHSIIGHAMFPSE